MENILNKDSVLRVQKKLDEYNKNLKAVVLNSSARTAKEAAENNLDVILVEQDHVLGGNQLSKKKFDYHQKDSKKNLELVYLFLLNHLIQSCEFY